MSDFFTAVNLDASAIGNHEFDFGPVFLLPYLSKKTSRNLAANIRSESGQSEFLPKQQKSTIYTFQNGINIGVIGLSTIETPTTTSGFGAGANKFPKYQFLDYKDIVIK